MSLYETGPVSQWTAFNANIIPNDVFGVAINWFINRTPLLTRAPKMPVGSPQFIVSNDNYRPRSNPMNNSGTLASGTTTVVATDSSIFDLGDVIQIESEYMLVTGNVTSTNTLTITRGYAGTSAASHVDAQSIFLVTNTRQGNELNINSVSRIPASITQYNQTIQHAYQIGGSLQADTNWTAGWSTPLDRDRMLAMQHTVDDFESAMYYGKAVAVSSGSSRPMMAGLLGGLLTSNLTTSPTNAAAYKPSDMIRDTMQACLNGGGNPSVLLLSNDFQQGLATWGQPAVRIPAGASNLGVSLDVFEVPFLSGLRMVPCPLLRPGTAICLSDPEVRIRLKRPMIDKPRGSRGDAFEGDIIMEGALEIANEAHHAAVSGITAFAAA